LNAAADSPGKRAVILEAAKKVFLEVGFGAASMDAIANEAKVSKQTVYNHFGSKEELFAAMVRDTCDSMTMAFAEAARDGNPENTLRAIAQRFMDTTSRKISSLCTVFSWRRCRASRIWVASFINPVRP